jgi:phosphatidylglycerophosphatase A
MCHGGSKGVFPIKDHLIRGLATAGGVGYIPVAPGTWGSVLGVGVALLLARSPLAVYSIGLIGLGGVGVWVAGAAEQLLGRKDASPIVIDEIVGILATYFALPMTIFPVVVGFVLFRLFDIIKPLPQLERLPGGWGIMLDDLCAGFLAQACVRLLLLVV